MAESKTVAVPKLELPKFRPTLSLDEEDLPQLKNLKVGDKCTLRVNVELVRQSKGPDYDSDGPKTLNGSFKIIGVEYIPGADKASRDDKLSSLKNKAETY